MSSQQQPAGPIVPSYNGLVYTTLDAICLFEAALSGRIPHVPRRPHDRERQGLIKSGSVFIYEEHSSGIKRWTDGVSWSPSRIHGNFLIYREVDQPFSPGEKKRALKRKKSPPGGVAKRASNASRGPDVDFIRNEPAARDLRPYVGSLLESYWFKPGGLVKKTISISYHGLTHHLVNYYDIDEAASGKLTKPIEDPAMYQYVPRPELLLSQNFRAPIDEADSGSGTLAMLCNAAQQDNGSGHVHLTHENTLLFRAWQSGICNKQVQQHMGPVDSWPPSHPLMQAPMPSHAPGPLPAQMPTQMSGPMPAQVPGQMPSHMPGHMHGHMHGQMHGQMPGQMHSHQLLSGMDLGPHLTHHSVAPPPLAYHVTPPPPTGEPMQQPMPPMGENPMNEIDLHSYHLNVFSYE